MLNYEINRLNLELVRTAIYPVHLEMKMFGRSEVRKIVSDTGCASL